MQGKQERAITITNRGETSAMLQAGNLAAGMYLYSLIADGRVIATKEMVLTN